jgi:hypothetical protein
MSIRKRTMRPIVMAFLFLFAMATPSDAEGCLTSDHFACLSSDAFFKARSALRDGDQKTFFALPCDFTEPGHKVEVLGPTIADSQLIAIFYGDSPVTKRSGIRDIFRGSAINGWVHVWTIKENLVCKKD